MQTVKKAPNSLKNTSVEHLQSTSEAISVVAAADQTDMPISDSEWMTFSAAVGLPEC